MEARTVDQWSLKLSRKGSDYFVHSSITLNAGPSRVHQTTYGPFVRGEALQCVLDLVDSEPWPGTPVLSGSAGWVVQPTLWE